MNNTGVIILGGGKGKRMGSDNVNKVALALHGKPMIRHVVECLVSMSLSPIIVVVGFAKESVIEALLELPVVFVEQKEQMGTAHAVACALKALPKTTLDVLVIQGDDSAFYKETVFNKLLSKHTKSGASVTFLTLNMENPNGLGRIMRDGLGNVIKVVEEKDATLEQKRIKEVNPACYIFQRSFLTKYLKNVKKSKITHEYYLTSLIDLAVQHHESIETTTVRNLPWRGVNTTEELSEAERLFSLNA